MKAAEGATGELKARKLKAGKLKARNQLERVGRMKKFPPVRLDVHSSIQPTPAFAKLALARSCVCIRSRVLLIWKWVANPMARLHCNSLHADKPLDCNRTGGNFLDFGWEGSMRLPHSEISGEIMIGRIAGLP